MVTIEQLLQKHHTGFHAVVENDPGRDRVIALNLDKTFLKQSGLDLSDMHALAGYINTELEKAGAIYGMGGYNEDRDLYSKSNLFHGIEPRSIHLGLDIWGPEGTKVYAPLGGTIHSFADNKGDGNYGPTIILQHQLETRAFHTLYGHLSKADLALMQEGKFLNRGELIGHVGSREENGNWPPHLHLQVIEDMRLQEGDYPGVCAPSERAFYLSNCADPQWLVNMKWAG